MCITLICAQSHTSEQTMSPTGLFVQLVSKISNLCDHKSPTLQTDGQTDRRHAIPRPRKCTKVHCAVKSEWCVNCWTFLILHLLVNFVVSTFTARFRRIWQSRPTLEQSYRFSAVCSWWFCSCLSSCPSWPLKCKPESTVYTHSCKDVRISIVTTHVNYYQCIYYP